MEFTGNSLAQRMIRLAMAGSRPSVRATSQTTSPSSFDRAIEHFAHGHWSEAFEELVPLADAGDCEAARIATLMVTQGPRLFGGTFRASSSQRKRWHVVASRAHISRTPSTQAITDDSPSSPLHVPTVPARQGSIAGQSASNRQTPR